jgi:dihydroorotate dehydrogenase electron transfer subunit
MRILSGEIISNEKYSDDLYRMEVFSPYICKNAAAGQFVNIKCSRDGILQPLLRRPFSIFAVEEKFNVFSVLYAVKGTGTKFMSGLERGDILDFAGPMGNGINLDESKVNMLLIGGGIGIAPLNFLARLAAGDKKSVFFAAGFKDNSFQKWEKDLIELKAGYSIYTEDGSWGEKGMITDYIRENLRIFNDHDVYCCGPKDMLKDIQRIYSEESNRVVALLEEVMACGVGVCAGCAVKIKKGKNSFSYKKVCLDGPAFDLKEVIFD